jgi:hypothetical protein
MMVYGAHMANGSTDMTNPEQQIADARAHLAALLRGPWTTAQVAHGAAVPVGRVRNWADRSPRRITPPEFLKLEGDERDAARQGFTAAELFMAVALGELGRNGIAPDGNEYLTAQIAADLFERAFGHRPRAGEPREPAEWFAAGWLVAEVRTHESDPHQLFGIEVQAARYFETNSRQGKGEPGDVSIQKVRDLAAYFAEDDRKASNTWIAVDTARLLSRALARVAEARRA